MSELPKLRILKKEYFNYKDQLIGSSFLVQRLAESGYEPVSHGRQTDMRSGIVTPYYNFDTLLEAQQFMETMKSGIVIKTIETVIEEQ